MVMLIGEASSVAVFPHRLQRNSWWTGNSFAAHSIQFINYKLRYLWDHSPDHGGHNSPTLDLISYEFLIFKWICLISLVDPKSSASQKSLWLVECGLTRISFRSNARDKHILDAHFILSKLLRNGAFIKTNERIHKGLQKTSPTRGSLNLRKGAPI